MAYNDGPKVDENFMKSQESENMIKTLFSSKNGFLIRDDKPDFGVDYMCELIESGCATNIRFPIQLKSTSKFKVRRIENEEYVALSFKTSRLKYLMKFRPNYGLIVIYEEVSSKMIYEHVDVIINWIDNYSSGDWRNSESVTIKIKSSNKVTKEKLDKIKNIFLERDRQLKLMILDYGARYGVPSEVNYDELNFETRHDKKICIAKFGMSLLSCKEYDVLSALLEDFEMSELLKDPRTTYISLLFYFETGSYLEAKYLISKIMLDIETYCKDDQVMILMIKNRIDLYFGEIDILVFEQKMSKLLESAHEVITKLNIRLLLLFSSLLQKNNKLDTSERINEISKQIEDLEDSNLDETQYFNVLIDLSQMLFYLMVYEWNRAKLLISIRNTSGFSMPIEERIGYVDKVESIQSFSHSLLTRAYDYSKSNQNDYLLMRCSYIRSFQFFTIQSNRMFKWIGIKNEACENETIEKEYINNIKTLGSLYNEFSKLQEYKSAYDSLYCCSELIILYEYKYDKRQSVFNRVEIDKTLKHSANILGHSSYESQIKKLLDFISSDEVYDSLTQMTKMSDSEMEEFALNIVEAHSLPSDRYEHIINDLKCHKRFYSVFEDGFMELLQNLVHTYSERTYYSKPIRYVAQCKKCRYQTAENRNIDVIINEIISDHKCL